MSKAFGIVLIVLGVGGVLLSFSTVRQALASGGDGEKWGEAIAHVLMMIGCLFFGMKLVNWKTNDSDDLEE